MSKTVFKVLSVIMALCVLLGAMPVTVFAQDETEYAESGSVIRFSPETELPVEMNVSANRFYGSGAQADTTRYFYSQLTANQKELYNQILSAGVVQKITVDLTNITITGKGTSSSSKNNAVNAAMNDIMMALTALNEDEPLFFWADGFGISYDGIKKYSGGTYTYTITVLIININIDTTHFADFNDVEEKRNAVVNKLNTIKINGISRHEKVKSIHDYLANNIVYDDTISEPNIYDPYGALITGVCVCEGYAEAFKLLCDREGIPCLNVVGTGNGGAHKWNMVQMEDGEWYTVDATWDDQTSNIYYSYFLIGSNTKAPWFNSTAADSTVHIPTGKHYTNATTALVYPTLSTDTYGVGILRYGAKDVHFDTARGVVMVGKGISSYVLFVANSGDYTRTRTGSGTTGTTLMVSDGITQKSYIVAMRGDVKKSNTVNSDDYNVMTQICSAAYTVEENSAIFYAGDMNQDGAIDGFDAIAHELYTNGDLVFD